MQKEQRKRKKKTKQNENRNANKTVPNWYTLAAARHLMERKKRKSVEEAKEQMKKIYIRVRRPLPN